MATPQTLCITGECLENHPFLYPMTTEWPLLSHGPASPTWKADKDVSAFDLPVILVLSPETRSYIYALVVITCIYFGFHTLNQKLSHFPKFFPKISQLALRLLDIPCWAVRYVISLLKLAPLIEQTSRPHPVYLLDYSTFKPPAEWQVPLKRFETIAGGNFQLPKSDVEWCCKLLEKSGIGEESAFPPGILDDPPHIGVKDAREEAETVIFTCCDNLFKNLGIKPSEIDILIVNCSLFVPTPSLCAMIINRYRMRPDIQSYNLGGMGCSAGVISLHLARDLLQVYRNARALVISTENITQNIYLGRKKNMLISNSLFRVGGAAIILSNRTSDYLNGSAQMKLAWTSRTHMGSDSTSYKSVWQDEDEEGFKGVSIDKKLTEVAGKALQVHLTKLAPWLLTWKEILLTLLFMTLRFVARCIRIGYRLIQRVRSKNKTPLPLHTPRPGASTLNPDSKSMTTDRVENKQPDSPSIRKLFNYMPSFHHPRTKVCVHAGGKTILDGIQQALKLPDEDLAAGRFVLHQFGNVSSASVWYELEAMHKLIDQQDTPLGQLVSEFCVQKASKGTFIWQLAFGSGFKVNSAMWKVLR